MGLLEKLWDDTVAGPRPDNGLGKLRKYNTFSFRSSSGKEMEGGEAMSYGGDGSVSNAASEDQATRVTRSITIVKPPGYQNNGSPPISPAGSSPPVSPFAASRGGFRIRRGSGDAYEKAAAGEAGIRSTPTT